MKKYIYFLGIIFIASACKKEKLPEQQDFNSPEFFVKCSVDGVLVSIEAGKNDNYMFASSKVNPDSVRVYCAEIKQKNCSNACGYSLKFEINDYKLSIYPSSIDTALRSGFYQINDSVLTPLYYRGTFFTSSSSSITPSLNWLVNNGQPKQGNNITYTFLKNTTPTISLSKADALCSQTHSNQFKIGNDFNFNISAYRDTTILKRNFTFSAFPNVNSTGYTYFWEFGDGSRSQLTNPTHAYAQPGLYRVKLTLVNSLGISEVGYYQIDATNPTICDGNYFANFVGVPNKKAFSAVNVVLVDNEGKEYSTKNSNQTINAGVEISSVEEYKATGGGQKTKKLKIRFNCNVFDGSKTISIQNGEAVIAVGY